MNNTIDDTSLTITGPVNVNPVTMQPTYSGTLTMNAPTLTIMSKDNDGYELSIFPDGRITYKGTPDEAARNFLDALCNVIDEEKCASRVANERSYKTIKTIIDEVQGLNKEEILTKLDELAVEAHRRWTWEILKDTK